MKIGFDAGFNPSAPHGAGISTQNVFIGVAFNPDCFSFGELRSTKRDSVAVFQNVQSNMEQNGVSELGQQVRRCSLIKTLTHSSKTL